MWIRLLYIPFILWFIYLVCMMIWNTISPGEPLKFYNKFIKPIYTIDKTNKVTYGIYNRRLVEVERR